MESYPCPKCGEYRLIYEGMLAWHGGPRPPRELASKEVSFSPRADYEREYLYHCDHCGAQFFQDVEQQSTHLYEENVAGQYRYNSAWRVWERMCFDPAKREWTIQRMEPPGERERKPGWLGKLTKTARTAPSSLIERGEEYIVQENDSLSELANRFYGQPAAWPAIWMATNLKFIGDDRFAILVEPDALRVGQRLWLPTARKARRVSTEAERSLVGVFFAPSGGDLFLRGTSGPSWGLAGDALIGPTWHLLRFYQDGLVLTATIQEQDLAGSWPRIERWFHRDSTNPGCAFGKYRRIGDCLSFFIDLERGRAYHTGVLSKGKITASSKMRKKVEYSCLDAAPRSEAEDRGGEGVRLFGSRSKRRSKQ